MSRVNLFLVCIAEIQIASAAVIKGVLRDSVSNAALPGVEVQIKGTTYVTTSDTQGRFSFNVTSVPVQGFTQPSSRDLRFDAASQAIILDIPARIRFLDASGKSVAAANGVVGRNKLPKLSDGTYSASIESDNASHVLRLVVRNRVMALCVKGRDGRIGAEYHPLLKSAAPAPLLFLKAAYAPKEMSPEYGDTNVVAKLAKIKYPDASNTGPTDPSILKASGDITVKTDGAIIENVNITGHIEVNASNVTIRNFKISTSTYWGIYVIGGKNILIEDGEIDGKGVSDNGVTGSNYTVERVHLHNLGGDAFKADGNNWIEACYIHDIGQSPGAHGDGVQMMGGSGQTIVGNNFNLVSGIVNASIFPGGGGPVTNILVQGNRINSGGWSIYCNTSMKVRHNVFGPAGGYGPVTNPCQDWVDNIWEETGKSIQQ